MIYFKADSKFALTKGHLTAKREMCNRMHWQTEKLYFKNNYKR